MKAFRAYSLCLTLCLLLCACAGAGKTEPPAAEEPPPVQPESPEEPLEADSDMLIVAIADEIEGLDVQQISYANIVHELISEPLVVYSADLTELHPAFAESYTLTEHYIEFVLPAGAKFSSGAPLDAAAVKASTERFLAVSEYAGDLDAVTGIDVIDERTVRYNLSESAPYSLATIASMFCGVVDVSEAERVGEWEFNRHPVMNGAYVVEEWVSGSHLLLRRNEYFQTSNPELKNHGPANYETILIRFIPDSMERLHELETGSVDIVYNAPLTEWARLREDSAYNIWSYQQPGVCYLNLQTEKGPLRDIAVRQALTYAVDRNALNELLGGTVTPSYGFIASPQTGYSAEEEAKLAEELRYDPEHAKRCLSASGWTDTNGDGILEKRGELLRFEMMIPNDRASFKAVGPVLAEQFSAIGADVHVVYYEADYIKELMHADEYDVGSRVYEWNDADILYWAFTGDAGYCWDDPELTELLTVARHANDPQARVEAYAAASERLAEDFKGISLFSDTYIIASKSEINGLVVALDDRVWFNDVTRS